MPREKTPLGELGSVFEHGREFRACLKFRDESNSFENIYGPNRTTEEQAQKDLEQIRKAAEKAETREEGLKMMRSEAQKLKDSAKYEAEIRETLQRMDSLMGSDSEDDYEDDDMGDDPDPPWMQEYPEEEELPESQTDRPTLSAIEATAELSRFRPVKSTPSDLKYLLEARADPNLPLKPGSISPLDNVITFAKMKHVAQMRELLLDFGASESDDDKASWTLRQRADFCEMIRINNAENIDKDYDPICGSVEY